jgi:ABC-type transport system involved in multi-copper enzyme maturation permease subunit
MTSPAVLYTVRLLIRDTFRQAIASNVFWLMLAISGVCICVCLSVGFEGATPLQHPGELKEFLPRGVPVGPRKAELSGVDILSGHLTIGFGAIRLELGRDAEDSVRFFQLLLAGGVADTLGILLALLWTAGFLPGLLERSNASVLFVKPVPRWVLLTGKYLGVLAFVTAQAAFFVGGTYIALGVRTGVWHPAYLWCVPVLVLHFAVFFSFSALLAVWSRSAIVCVIGSLSLWFVAWGANFAHLARIAHDAPVTAGRFPAEVAYWLLPKPAEVSFLLQELLDTTSFFARLPELNSIALHDAFSPLTLLLTSVAFVLAVLALAGRRLARMDY